MFLNSAFKLNLQEEENAEASNSDVMFSSDNDNDDG